MIELMDGRMDGRTDAWKDVWPDSIRHCHQLSASVIQLTLGAMHSIRPAIRTKDECQG